MMLNFYFIKNSKLGKILLPIPLQCIIITAFLLFFLSGCLQTGYFKENGKWIYVTYDEGVGRRVQNLNVDNDTFTILKNKKYAKDKNAVFYEGDVIKDASPNTFEVINDRGYSKDTNYVFVDFDKVIGANPQTFVYLGYPYSKDDKDVYCGTLPMFVKNIDEFKVTEFGSNDKTTSSTTFFIESNPEYAFIDPQKYEGIVYGYGKGETKDQKFEGYKLVK